jgi:hypothetical protein
MGIPDFNYFTTWNVHYKYRHGLIFLYLIGIFAFFVSLFILHDPVLYDSLHYFTEEKLKYGLIN